MKLRLIETVLLTTASLACAVGPAMAENFSAEQLAHRTVERRAVEAAIWGMPMVSVDAMRPCKR